MMKLDVPDLLEDEKEKAGAEAILTPDKWEVVARTVRGPKHVRLNKPNQDSMAYLSASTANGSAIAAVADGHGGEMYFRSEKGAALATNRAVNMMHVFLEFHGKMDRGALEAVLHNEFTRDLLGSWKEAVEDDLILHPFSDVEKRQLMGHPGIVAYGATLLLTASTPKLDIFLQLGDGDIVTACEGQPAEVVFPRALVEEYYENITDSLCSTDALSKFRVRVVPRVEKKKQLTMVYSDGYSNSFDHPTAGPQRAAEDYLGILSNKHGLNLVKKLQESWLFKRSEVSRDDTTMALLWKGG